MKRLTTVILVLSLLSACSTNGANVNGTGIQADQLSGQERPKEDCSRFGSATRAYGDIFNPIKMQKRAINDCGGGNGLACLSAPVAMPYTMFLGAVGAPLLFPILLVSNAGCPRSESQ